MNYPDSNLLLEKIESSNNILISCHYRPDSDGVGSALAFYLWVKEILGKDASIICPSDIPENLKFLNGVNEIKKTDFASFDTSKFDLWIIPDSANWWQITGKQNYIPKFINDTFKVDHHLTNDTNDIKGIVDPDASSACEVLYKIMLDLKLDISSDIANALLTGILGDTNVLRLKSANSNTFKISGKLIDLGAQKQEIVNNLFKSYSFEALKMIGEVLSLFEFDTTNNFVWVSIPLEIYEKYGKPEGIKSDIAANFASTVKDANFGVVIIEEKKDFVGASLWSRDDYDVSKIAQELGGGGHEEYAGLRLTGMSLIDATEKILEVCRKYAKKS